MIQFLIALITTLVIISIPLNKFNIIIDEIESEIKEIKQYNSVQIDSVYNQLIEIQAELIAIQIKDN